MGNWWSIVHSFEYPQPVTTILVISMILVYIYQWRKKIDSDRFAFRYDAIVKEGQYWRCISSTFSHLNIWHIFTNMWTLWILGASLENSIGSILYVKYTYLFIIGTSILMLCISYLLSKYRPTWLHLTNGAGYSGILFAWLMYYALQDPLGTTDIFTLNIPNIALPFIYLIFIQIILLNRVSFLGHISGIMIGIIIGEGCLRWFDDYSLLIGCIWLLILCCYNISTNGSDLLQSFFTVITSNNNSLASGRRVEDGRLIYSDRPNI